MTLKEKLASLADGHWLMIVSPKIEHLMTGAAKCGVMKSGLVRVAYEDGMEESRMACEAFLANDADGGIGVTDCVSYVQAGRKPE